MDGTIRRWKNIYSVAIILITFMLINSISLVRGDSGLEVNYTVPDDDATAVYLSEIIYIVFTTSIPDGMEFTLTDDYGTAFEPYNSYITTNAENDTVAFVHSSRWHPERTYNITLTETTTNTTYTWTITTQNFGEYSARVVMEFWLWTIRFFVLFLAIVVILSVVKPDGVINDENTKYK